jgi:drug/metabolite transporter (DMT)-like permease
MLRLGNFDERNVVGLLLVIGFFWALAIYVAHQIGRPKHRAGFAWGLFLGWLGVLCVALLPARPEPGPLKPF